jgi:predicted CXXCH cytochrome family protein
LGRFIDTPETTMMRDGRYPGLRRAWLTRPWLIVLALLLLATASRAGNNPHDYLGSEVCASCHAAEAEAWRGSHHDLAMQAPTPDTVLGDFDDARFRYGDIETRFYKQGDEFRVSTDGPDGKIQDFRVAWVFGVYPLQQYLLPLDDGRLQALSITWDARPASEGGQRWYHLYPDEVIDHDDPLHWTGPYQNWNSRCAECHSTNVEKGYDAASRSFATRFDAEDVGCEACHGPGRLHVERARAGLPASASDSALYSLVERGRWSFPEKGAIARRDDEPEGVQLATCGRCHARRGTLGSYRHGQPLSDMHRLALLGEPLYHHDGQILDEVYVYGSFLQSRMHRAGVVCSNCHEPHSSALRAQGNGVCTQCHKSEAYASDEHHHHAQAATGNQCVDCHMPSRVYMGVDARRDHSLRTPRPDLSLKIGTPNACNDCHTDRDPRWALEALRAWDMTPADTADHPALAMEAVARGDVSGVPRLLSLASDPKEAVIWRATALERSAALSDKGPRLAVSLLASPEPLLRISAVQALDQLPLAERYQLISHLHRDPVLGVRMAVADSLAGVPDGVLDANAQSALDALFDEYLAVQQEHADMPSVQMQIGLFQLERGAFDEAESAYREALRINPQLTAAALNLADLLRGQARDDEARAVLQRAVATAPDSGDAYHALGLLEVRAGQREAAMVHLARAAALERSGGRHRFVYAVALHDFGDTPGAIRVLTALHQALPADEQTLLALVNYSAEEGDRDAAVRYLQRLSALAPDNATYRRMARALRGGGS